MKDYIKETQTMLQIGDTLISLDLLEKKFLCPPAKCLGKCCVLGDYGAPIEKDEINIIERNRNNIEVYMTPNGLETISKSGFFMEDDEGELVTTLINGQECVFVFFEDGIAKCAIEKAFEKGKIEIQKPVSCHLYPVRIKKYESFTAVNYSEWHICDQALVKGEEMGIFLYKFLKDPLTRKFGQEWYDELELAAESLAGEE